ncbi:MAG: hypothetical protein OSB09_04290, partial [Planctomycetota bacterium]|nr:hypothetical protein [Planctomycetota bacterium]
MFEVDGGDRSVRASSLMRAADDCLAEICFNGRDSTIDLRLKCLSLESMRRGLVSVVAKAGFAPAQH